MSVILLQAPGAATPPLPANTLEVTAAIAIVATLAVALGILLGSLVRRVLLAALGGDTPGELRFIAGAVRLVRAVTILIGLLVLGFPALDAAGVDLPVGLDSNQLGRWFVSTGVRIAVVVVLAAVLVRAVAALSLRAEQELVTGTDTAALERRKRTQTIASLVRTSVSTLIWAMAVLMILRELDIDVTPVLTGAGIVGLAVGFGAQTLVKDVIAGVFLIIEDQVRVGDVAMVNGIGGGVEQINLRTIVLRDFEGTVHVFPNGSITTLANRTKDFAYYVIDLGIDYDEDPDRVVEACRETAEEMRRDPVYGPFILEPLEIAGMDSFGASAVTLKMRIKTVPLKQWEVGRELRRRFKKAFDRRGIRLPFPQVTVSFAGQGGAGEAIAAAGAAASGVAPAQPPR
jgi:small-conductance mechanosensitive channel